jgi:hypothetical protein
VTKSDAPRATQEDDRGVETLFGTEVDRFVADASEMFAETDGNAAHTGASSEGDRILSVAQVARRLGCSVSLVQKWRRLGWIPAIQLGPPDVPIYGYRVADVDAYAGRAWNRRRGRPPKDPNAAPTPRRRAAAAVDEYTMGDPSDDALEEVTRATQPARPTAPVVAPAQRPVIVPAARATAPAKSPEARPAPVAPAPPLVAETSRPIRPTRGRPPKPIMTGPLTIWAGDPRDRGALMLVRLPPGPMEQAITMAERYAQRHDDIVLSEAQGPGLQAAAAPVLGRWERGARTEG